MTTITSDIIAPRLTHLRIQLYLEKSKFRKCEFCEDLRESEVLRSLPHLPQMLGIEGVEYQFEIIECEWEVWREGLDSEEDVERIENYFEFLGQFERFPAMKIYAYYDNLELETHSLDALMNQETSNDKNTVFSFFSYIGNLLGREVIPEAIKGHFQHEKANKDKFFDGDHFNERIQDY